MDLIENITWNCKPLAYIVRREFNPDRTNFFAPRESNFQAGFVVYPKGGEIIKHVHLPLERHIIGTPEVLFIRKGECNVDVYNEDKKLVATRKLRQGDVLILLGGGHGFRMLKDTVFLEIKQGPYTGVEEKERF